MRKFTNFKDKNNKKIYEGDILLQNNMKGIVSYCNEDKRFEHQVLIKGNWKYGHYLTFNSPIESKKCSVIGNVYKNPGLLK